MLLTFLVSLCLGLRFEYSLDWRRDLKLAQVEVGHLFSNVIRITTKQIQTRREEIRPHNKYFVCSSTNLRNYCLELYEQRTFTPVAMRNADLCPKECRAYICFSIGWHQVCMCFYPFQHHVIIND